MNLPSTKFESLRTVSEKKEIRKMFFEIYGQTKILFIWQPEDAGRIKTYGRIHNIDSNRNVIDVNPIKNSTFNFNKNFPIYVYCEHRMMILKEKLIFNSKLSLSFNIPDNLKCIESRSNPRTKISRVSQEYFIHFTPSTEKDLSTRPRQRTLLDLSNQGISFEISLGEESKYYLGDKLKLKEMPLHLGITNDLELLEGRITNISAIYDNTGVKKNYRVGVHLNKEFVMA